MSDQAEALACHTRTEASATLAVVLSIISKDPNAYGMSHIVLHLFIPLSACHEYSQDIMFTLTSVLEF